MEARLEGVTVPAEGRLRRDDDAGPEDGPGGGDGLDGVWDDDAGPVDGPGGGTTSTG